MNPWAGLQMRLSLRRASCRRVTELARSEEDNGSPEPGRRDRRCSHRKTDKKLWAEAENFLRCMGTAPAPRLFFSPALLFTEILLLFLPSACLVWQRQDPEGLFGPPQKGHLARREFQRRLEKDAEAREAFTRQVREENERLQALRQAWIRFLPPLCFSRAAPDTVAGLIEYFLDTEAQEIEFEIARLRLRVNCGKYQELKREDSGTEMLDKEFFAHLQSELGQLRFAVTRTEEMEDRVIELEAMQKVLLEGTEAYDKMQSELVLAKQRLAKILQSKDKKATLLDMIEKNEIDRTLLTLLDENIASAHQNNQLLAGSFMIFLLCMVSLQKQVADFMEKIRAAVLKYITLWSPHDARAFEMRTLQAHPLNSFCFCRAKKAKKLQRRQQRDGPQKKFTTRTDLPSFGKPSSPTPLLISQTSQPHTKHQKLDEIVREIKASQDRGVQIEPKLFSSLLETCFQIQSLDHGIVLHRLIPPKILRRSVDLSSKLLRLYASFGLVEEAQHLFDQMPHQHVNAFAWNSLISGYTELRLYEEAMAVYNQMEEDGVHPDRCTFPRVLKACAGLRSIQIGEAVHRHIVRSGFAHDQFVLNALVDMYAKCGDIVKARKVFDMISQRDVVSWNAMLVGYVQHELFDEALHIFQQMSSAGFEPDSIAISALLGRFSPLRLGSEIHGWVIRRGLDQNLSVANSLISMYGELGHLQQARELFVGMVDRDTVSWNAIISACGKDCQQALTFFHQMENSCSSPDAITFVSLLSACANSAAVGVGRQLFAKMEDIYGIRPQMEHCACMVNLLGKAGFLDEAYDFITTKMAFEAGPTVWGALLYACSIYGNIDVGEIAAERLFELEPDNEHNFELMMKIYTDHSRWEDVEMVRKMMRDRGLD
ncbi:hypothetical protein ACLOJK_005445 [Asimina triloba]